MLVNVEFKIKQANIAWEQMTPTIITYAVPSEHDAGTKATSKAAELAVTWKTEVRWNYQGSPMGHYVGSTPWELSRLRRQYPVFDSRTIEHVEA